MNKNNAVGVFDSGVGGLTVLERLVELLPFEDFIYVADQAHCPYGIKTALEVGDRVESIARYLAQQEVKAIVIACNTASLQIERARAVTDVDVLSVIPSTCDRAVSLTRNGKVAVIGTVATIKSNVYQDLLRKSGKTPIALACSEFVDFVERQCVDTVEADKLVGDVFKGFTDTTFDTLIQGCTHFGLLEKSMRKCLPYCKNFVECGQPTATTLKKLLADNNLLTARKSSGTVRIYTTGEVVKAENAMKWFPLQHQGVFHVDI